MKTPREGSKNTKLTLLAVSPTYTSGSWIVVEEMLKQMKNRFDITTIGLGPGRTMSDIKTVRIPYFTYEQINPKYGSNILFNTLYQIPLQIGTFLGIMITRPKVILSNGFTPILLSLPIIKILNIPVFIYYGTFLKRVMKSRPIYLLLKTLNSFITGAFVNSQSSKDDLTPLVNKEKITIISHWTDLKPYSPRQRKKLRTKWKLSEKDFVLLFVGRFCLEKSINKLMALINEIRDVPNLKFWFVGKGPLINDVATLAKKRKDVEYKGFVTNREKLREIYTVSNLLWTYADETYVAKPGVEALALGTPLMIPNTAAIIEKHKKNIKIKNDLTPKNVGWIIDDENMPKVYKLLKRIVKDKIIDDEFRKNCIKFAKKKHSKDNVEEGIKKILLVC